MSDTVQIERNADPTTIESPEISTEITEIVAEDLSPIEQAADDFDTDQTPEWVQQFGTILAELPKYLGQVYQNNKGAIVTLGLFFALIVTLKLTLAVLAAINGIPLLAPTFQLIGIVYTAWFVYRYLLHASTRDELTGEIDGLKSEIFGSYDHN